MGKATQFLTWPNSQQFSSLFAPVTLYQARSPPYFACAPVTLPTEPHAKPQAPRPSPARDRILTNKSVFITKLAKSIQISMKYFFGLSIKSFIRRDKWSPS